MSTSDAQSEPSSRQISEVPPPRPSLRSIAPRPPAVTRPSQPQRLVVPSSIPHRAARPPICPVCLCRGCQLKTHRAIAAHSQRRESLAPTDKGSGISSTSVAQRLRTSIYTKSYAYYYAQIYVDADIASSRVDPFFDLPLPSEINNPEMHSLFHRYFTAQPDRTVALPRPPELSSDLVLSPFFFPAINDSALCLAVLAASAASLPQHSGWPANNVTVLTLIGQAMYQLRERLISGPVSDATVVAATFLWGINSLLNDPDSMLQHSKSVHILVSRRGGLSSLGLNGAVAQLVTMIDNLNAIIFGEKTLYSIKIDATPLENEPAPVCGAFFTGPRAQKSLDPVLSKLCFQSAGVANLLERMILTRSTTPDYFHAMAKLATIGSDTTNIYVGFKGAGSMDECVCLAMQLMNITIYYQPREQQMMVATQASRLISALQKQDIPGYWLAEMELLVWILFVVAMIPHDFEGKEWAMDQLCHALCSKLGAEEWPANWEDTVHRVVLNFIWCDARLAPGFATICRSIALRVFGEHEDY